MVKDLSNPFIDAPRLNPKAAGSTLKINQITRTESTFQARVVEVLDAGKLRVEYPLDSPTLTGVGPSDGTITAVGAVVQVLVGSDGKIAKIFAPTALPDDAEVVATGAAGWAILDAQNGVNETQEALAAAKTELESSISETNAALAENTTELATLNGTTIPGLQNDLNTLTGTTLPGLDSRLSAAEDTLSPLPDQIAANQAAVTTAQNQLDTLNSETLSGLEEDMADAARLTRGMLDNERLAVGELSALIANVINLNVSRLVASDAAIDSAVLNKIAVGVATIIELNADRITAGTVDTARLNVAELAADLAVILNLDVSRLVASDASIDTAVISKLSVGIAEVIQLSVDKLIADDAHFSTAVAQQIVADTASFLQITTDMLIAGGAKITGTLLADVITLATRLVAGDPNGDRTELNPSGLHIFKDGDEQVILSPSVENGLSVRNPRTGLMQVLSNFVFGAQSFSRSGEMGVLSGTNGNWGEYAQEWLTGTFTAQSDRYMAVYSATTGPTWYGAAQIEAICDIRWLKDASADWGDASNPNVWYTRFGTAYLFKGPTQSGDQGIIFNVVNTVVGREYRLFHAARARQTEAGAVWYGLYPVSAILMPV